MKRVIKVDVTTAQSSITFLERYDNDVILLWMKFPRILRIPYENITATLILCSVCGMIICYDVVVVITLLFC